MAVDDRRHGDEDTYPGATADRIEGRRRLVGNAQPEFAGIAAGERLPHLRDISQRLPDLIASGDDDAPRVEQPEAGERGLLRGVEDAGQARADRREGGIDGCCLPCGPGRQDSVGGKIEAGLDRQVGVVHIAPARGHRRAEPVGGNAGVAHVPSIDGGDGGALRDQLRLGLADQLVLVEAKEEQADQRQGHHQDQDGDDDRGEARPPFAADPLVGGRQPHRPSRKPTPCTVSMTSTQPATASLARMLRIWLSTVRSATWMLAA